MSRSASIAVGLVAALIAATPALAQKSADTLRLAINDMFPLMDPYNFPLDENAAFYRTVYQGLTDLDEHNGKFVPTLAKSWKRLSPSAIEFDLREDAVFDNGDKFTAEDVKATFAWASDEKTRIRFKDRYDWVKEVEILGPHKIIVHSKMPTSSDMANLSYNLKVLNKNVLNKLEDKSTYGRVSPVATGPYKVISIDPNKGIIVERVENYKGDPGGYYRAPTKRVHGIPIPDRQTQQAQLLTGGVDVVRNVTQDDADALSKAPNLAVTNTPSAMLLYVTLDAVGRSSNKVMTDERVRKAFMMAIDRKAFTQGIIPAGKTAEIPRGICFKDTVACKLSTDPTPYDPAQAKKLLAEAGYPNGIDLLIHAHQPVAYVATALSGELRKVGIRATVEQMPIGVYVKKRGDGEFTAFVGFYPTSANPDTSNLLNFFFDADRDYWRDEQIIKARKDGDLEFDVAKRADIYLPALNRVNEKAYVYPISELPLVWAHGKDAKVLRNPLSAGESRLGDHAWADFKPKEYK